MRFIKGFIAILFWALLILEIMKGFTFSQDAVLLSFAIVAAGAMAGGD